MDRDDCDVAPAVGRPKRLGLAGSVVLAETLAKAKGVGAFCDLCAVAGKHEPLLGWLLRACGRGGWSPWEGSGAR